MELRNKELITLPHRYGRALAILAVGFLSLFSPQYAEQCSLRCWASLSVLSRCTLRETAQSPVSPHAAHSHVLSPPL